MISVWHSLEIFGRFPAFPAVWERHAGTHYQGLKILCLQASALEAASYPCPRHCGCSHRIIRRHDQTGAVGVCRCSPPTCPDFPLTINEITPLQLDAAKLGRALCKALLLTAKTADFPFLMTSQIGSCFVDASPVILTIQKDPDRLRNVISELSLRLQKPYILLAPTSLLLNANAQELLTHAKAAFFPLNSIVILTDHGTLRAVSPPNELFAAFSPSSTPHSALHIPHSQRSTTPSLHHSIPSPCSHQSINPSIHQSPPSPVFHQSTNPSIHQSLPRFALRKGLRAWQLIFDSNEAPVGHERGVFYAVWLLYHPPENPIHALDLAAKIPEIYRQQLGLPALVDPVTGIVAPLQSGARIQERSLALDDREAMRAVFKQIKEREAILDDEHQSEPVKAEALRELEQLYEFQRLYGRRTKDSAQRVVRSVRMAITRFHHHLATALDKDGLPHPVLRPFADHLEKYLLIPSARYSGPSARRARAHLAGCFTYDPPAGIPWSH